MDSLKMCSNKVFSKIIDMQQLIVTNLNARFPATSNKWKNTCFPYITIVKQYPSATYKGNNGQRIPPHLPITPREHHNKGTQAAIYETWQWGITSIPEPPQGKKFRLPAGTSWNELAKHSGEVHRNLQGTLHCVTLKYHPDFPIKNWYRLLY